MKKTIKKVLEDWAEDTKSDIVNKIISKGAVDTGRLRDSIDFEIKEEGDKYKVYFEMVDYGKFVDGLVNSLNNGWLLLAMTQIKMIPEESLNNIMTADILLGYRNDICEFLGYPTVQNYND